MAKITLDTLVQTDDTHKLLTLSNILVNAMQAVVLNFNQQPLPIFDTEYLSLCLLQATYRNQNNTCYMNICIHINDAEFPQPIYPSIKLPNQKFFIKLQISHQVLHDNVINANNAEFIKQINLFKKVYRHILIKTYQDCLHDNLAIIKKQRTNMTLTNEMNYLLDKMQQLAHSQESLVSYHRLPITSLINVNMKKYSQSLTALANLYNIKLNQILQKILMLNHTTLSDLANSHDYHFRYKDQWQDIRACSYDNKINFWQYTKKRLHVFSDTSFANIVEYSL